MSNPKIKFFSLPRNKTKVRPFLNDPVYVIRRQHWTSPTRTHAHTHTTLKASLSWYCFVWQMAAYFTFLKTVRSERETEEHWRVVWNVTLLNLGCCWRKQAAGRPTDRPTTLSQLLLLPVEAKLCDRSRSGIERDSLSRSRDGQTDLHTKPNRKDTSHNSIS